MGKQLITRKNYQAFISGEDKKFYVNRSMILSPGVKDILRDQGFMIVYKEKPEIVECTNNTSCLDMHSVIVNVLKKDFNIQDDACIDKIAEKVLEKLKSAY